MKTEFNLESSDKKIYLIVEEKFETWKKEFIRLLKEKFADLTQPSDHDTKVCWDIIDKLAGEKLI